MAPHAATKPDLAPPLDLASSASRLSATSWRAAPPTLPAVLPADGAWIMGTAARVHKLDPATSTVRVVWELPGDDMLEGEGLHYAAFCKAGTTCPEDCIDRQPFLGNASGPETTLEIPRCSPKTPGHYEVWILRQPEEGSMEVLSRHGPLEALPRSDEQQEAHRMKNWKKLGGGVQMTSLVEEALAERNQVGKGDQKAVGGTRGLSGNRRHRRRHRCAGRCHGRCCA